MENIECKNVRVKNRTCYYYDDRIKLENFDLENIFIDKKSHENILIYEISCKTLICPKPVCTRFEKIDGFIRTYDGTRYLTLFCSKKYDAISDRIRYLISLKSGITCCSSPYFAKIKVNSYYFLPTEKRLTFHRFIIHIKSKKI